MTMKRVFQQLEIQKKEKVPATQIGMEQLQNIHTQWQTQLQQSQTNYNELEIQIQLLRKKQQQCKTNQHCLKDRLSKLEIDMNLIHSQLKNPKKQS